MSTLQGKKLAAVVAEVLDDKAAEEVAKQKAEVKRVVDQVTSDIKHGLRTLKLQSEIAAETEKRLAALNKRLKLLKAGDQGALKAPPAETIGRHYEAIHANLVRDMEVEDSYLRSKRSGPRYITPFNPHFRAW